MVRVRYNIIRVSLGLLGRLSASRMQTETETGLGSLLHTRECVCVCVCVCVCFVCVCGSCVSEYRLSVVPVHFASLSDSRDV